MVLATSKSALPLASSVSSPLLHSSKLTAFSSTSSSSPLVAQTMISRCGVSSRPSSRWQPCFVAFTGTRKRTYYGSNGVFLQRNSNDCRQVRHRLRQQPSIGAIGICASSNGQRRQSVCFFSSTGESQNESLEQQKQPQKSPPSSSTSSSTEEKPLLLDPRAPLRPLLPTLSQYALPPTNIGSDDYRPTLPRNQRIVAFGDVHGDIDALRSFLVTAKIMDPDSTNDDPKWCGGTDICVQTGDVLDRGDDELACFRMLASLSRQAHEAGGALYLLYGNHESLNAAGLFQYANPGGNLEFERHIGMRIDYHYGSNRWRLQFAGNQPSRWASFEPGGILAENMLSHMLVSVVVGRTVFVHAGLMASHLRDYGGVSGMNALAREWILKAHHGDNNNWGEYATVEEVIAAAQNRAQVAAKSMPDCLGGGIGASSPVWMRDYSQPNDKEPKDAKRAKTMIEEALMETGPDIQRMVMGHTPQFRINSALGGRAWRIDVGASRGVMGGTPEVLEIIHMGGEEGEDIVSVLKMDGQRISGKDRAVDENFFL